MKTIDFRKTYGAYYFPSAKEVTTVTVPVLSFVMVDGTGNPNTTPAFHQALEALFAVSYGLRFALKKQGVADYRTGPLEALWWTADDGTFDFDAGAEWKWTAMVLQPEVVTRPRFEDARSLAGERRDLPALSKLRLDRYREGMSAQVLHVGPYAAERPTIERLHAFIRDRGYRLAGKHHEIYLGDPRRAAPERLKTILRQPMRR